MGDLMTEEKGLHLDPFSKGFQGLIQGEGLDIYTGKGCLEGRDSNISGQGVRYNIEVLW